VEGALENWLTVRDDGLGLGGMVIRRV